MEARLAGPVPAPDSEREKKFEKGNKSVVCSMPLC